MGTPLLGTKVLASPLQSNLMTPRTQQLYAFGESASSDLEKVRNYFNSKSQPNVGGVPNLKNNYISSIRA